MRGSRTLLIALGTVVSAGLLVELAAPAAGFTLSGSSGSSSTSTSTTSGVSTATTTATAEDVSAALFALAAGGKTLGGPSAFLASLDGDERIYEVLTGGAPSVCVTLRNLSGGQIRISANNAISTDLDAGESRTACYTTPSMIDLRCRQGASCQAVWRIDRQ
jgi:hypothetical protein